MTYKNIEIEFIGKVGLVRLNRPKALNALCDELISELGHALDDFEKNDEVRCVVLTGSEKAFAAGADIKEMAPKTYMSAYMEDFITNGWEKVTVCRKPVIAAVSGFALGGGCELAMMCDFIIAADNAQFGQPEIKLGIIPGAGGTQRLPRFVGKSKAMEMVLTGRMVGGQEAAEIGLVQHVYPDDELIPAAREMAQTISRNAPLAVKWSRDLMFKGLDGSLDSQLLMERHIFDRATKTEDHAEAVKAFLEKRDATFYGR